MRRIGVPAEFAAAVLLLIFVAVAAPGLIAPGDPLAVSPTEGFLAPSLVHPFGTDESGRDILTRIVHGARSSASIGHRRDRHRRGARCCHRLRLGARSGAVDAALTRVVEVLYSLPTLVMALLFVAVIGPGRHELDPCDRPRDRPRIRARGASARAAGRAQRLRRVRATRGSICSCGVRSPRRCRIRCGRSLR